LGPTNVTDVRLDIAGYADSDEREREKLGRELAGMLRRLDVEDVSAVRRPAPEGAKGDALQWAQLVVTSVGVLPALLTALRGWLGRHPGASVSIEIDGDSLTLSEPSSEERGKVVSAWQSAGPASPRRLPFLSSAG
jgi:hypothetical protein